MRFVILKLFERHGKIKSPNVIAFGLIGAQTNSFHNGKYYGSDYVLN
jgi:hypothetical protein